MGCLGQFVGRMAVHSEIEIRTLCSKIDVNADRETSPLFLRMFSELKMPLCEGLFTRCSTELLPLYVAIPGQPVAFQFDMQSTSERDWFRASHAEQAIEPHLVCRVHRLQ